MNKSGLKHAALNYDNNNNVDNNTSPSPPLKRQHITPAA